MPDRDPPIEEPDEFSELAKQLGDALDSDEPAGGGGGSDVTTVADQGPASGGGA